MNHTITQNDIVTGLKALGISPGMNLEVHSSLSSFGYVEGGPKAVIAALQKTVTREGAIVMPSFRLSPPYKLRAEENALGITLRIKILDDHAPSSGMGLIADTFRQYPDVITGSGIFRVSAWGKEAQKHVEGFGEIIQNGGYTLLMGVDIYTMSSMHYVENYMPEEIKNKFKVSAAAAALFPEDTWHVEAWSPPCMPWYKVQKAGYEKGLIKDIMIGGCKCMLLRTADIVGIYKSFLLEDPFGFYELDA